MAWKRGPQKIYDEASLYEYAVGALGRRMRSVAELKRLMRQKMYKQENAEELMDAVVSRLKDQRYLNDAQYAAAYSGFRKNNEKFGRRRVEQELKTRGVHGDVIEKAVGETYEGVSEERQARDYLARKRLKKPTDQKQTARVFRSLVRAGFGTRVIVQILKTWDVEDETLIALEQETAEQQDHAEGDES
jgi:regulatory protein